MCNSDILRDLFRGFFKTGYERQDDFQARLMKTTKRPMASWCLYEYPLRDFHAKFPLNFHARRVQDWDRYERGNRRGLSRDETREFLNKQNEK
jgi:hypothetical protein